jgi:hypothetical protein
VPGDSHKSLLEKSSEYRKDKSHYRALVFLQWRGLSLDQWQESRRNFDREFFFAKMTIKCLPVLDLERRNTQSASGVPLRASLDYIPSNSATQFSQNVPKPGGFLSESNSISLQSNQQQKKIAC